MKKRMKKLLALMLAASMTVCMSGGVYASEVSNDEVSLDTKLSEDAIEAPSEEGSKIDSSAENGVTAAMTTAVKLREEAAALTKLEAGVDYVDGEGIFLADTIEDAEKIAAEYKAEVKRFAEGIAVIDFDRSSVDALLDTADAEITTTAVEPNFLYYLDVERSGKTDEKNTLTPDEPCNTDEDGIVKVRPAASSSPNDPWADPSSSYYQWGHDMIHTETAHDTSTGKGVTVAVIDTGINIEHPEFDGKAEAAFSSQVPEKRGVDIDGHGSNCAGIVGAIKNNKKCGYGVAPDAEIYSVQVSITGKGIDTGAIIEAVRMSIHKGVQVISMSLGGYGYSTLFQMACTEAAENGITVVAAAGNECTDEPAYPASYDNVISVASADNAAAALSDFSNYGNTVDIVAPGGAYIFSVPPYGSSKEASGMGGTSQATPHVAGVAALMYSANEDFIKDKSIATPKAIEKILLETTDDVEYIYDDHSVTGLVQADDAVEAASKFKAGTPGTYTLVDESGDYARFMTGNLCQGGSLKLAIGDATGNIKAVKAMAKSAVWASSNPAMVTVKKGKVKCNKAAALDSIVDVTATIGTEVLTYEFVIVPKTKYFGTYSTIHTHKGYKYKFKNGFSGSCKVGTSLVLTNPYMYTKGKMYLFYPVSKKQYQAYYADTDSKYDITMSKSQLAKCTVEYDRNNKPRRIIFTAPGKYSIKYKLLDGSKKSCTVKIKVS